MARRWPEKGSMWLGALVAIATMGAFSDSASIPLRHGAVPEQQACRGRHARSFEVAMVRSYDFTTKATNSLNAATDQPPPL